MSIMLKTMPVSESIPGLGMRLLWPHEQASHKHIHNLLASLIVGHWVAGSGNEATVAS